MPVASLPGLVAADIDSQPRSLLRGKVDPGYAALTRLVGRGLQATASDGLTLHASFARGQAAGGADSVLLEGPQGALYLEAGVPFLMALTGIDVSACDAAPAEQQAWLEGSVLGLLANTPLGGMTRVVRRPSPMPAPEQITLHLSLQDGTHAAGTLAQAGADCWHAMFGALALQPARVPQAAFHAVATTLATRIARHALPPSTLHTLKPGDVIIPARPDVDLLGEGWLRCANRLARVRYGCAGTIEFLSLESAMETQAETSVPAEPSAAAPDLDRTPLQLEFRLGALGLTLGQLQTVAQGSVFQLDGAADGSVAIVCGGQCLGMGEPVDVAGRLGIRITRWDVPC